MADKAGTTQPNRISAIILFAVIGGAPFPFGSSSHIAIAFWCGALGLCLLLASPRHLNKAQVAVLLGVALIIAAYAFVLHEQLSDTPWIASPNPIWKRASDVLGIPLKPSVSIVRGEPFYALGAPLSFILALICGLIVGADRTNARRALWVLGWSGVAYAVYGIFNLLFQPSMVLWRERPPYTGGGLTATFINRNTAATYFGCCAAIWLFLLFQRVRERLPKGPVVWKKVPEEILRDANRDVVIRFSMFFLCLAAMFMTGSRAGVIVSLFAMITAFIIFFRRDLPRGKGLLIAIAGGGMIAMILLQVMGGNVGYRFDVGGLSDLGRFETYRSMLHMIADRPWFGFGLGTFPWALPSYRSGNISMSGVWDIGHSTPLEFAVELGVPLTVIVAAAWIIGFGILIVGIRRGRRRDIIPASALTVCLIAQLHSTVDFSLQIPGYAIVAAAVLGIGLAQSMQRQEDVIGPSRSPASPKLSHEPNLP